MQDTWDEGSIPGLERSPRRGHGNPLQYFYLKNPMDRRAWQATVHRVAKSQTQLKWQHKQWESLLTQQGVHSRAIPRLGKPCHQAHRLFPLFNSAVMNLLVLTAGLYLCGSRRAQQLKHHILIHTFKDRKRELTPSQSWVLYKGGGGNFQKPYVIVSYAHS